MSQTRRWVLSTVLTATLLASAAAANPALAAPSKRFALPGTAPSWAQSSRTTGVVNSHTTVSFSIVLPLRDAAGASSLAASVSDPKSSQYGQYLTPAQFNARFAPTAAQIASVRKFVTGAGMRVTSVAAGNAWVSASGTVAQINKTFGVTLRTYKWQGRQLKAPDHAVSLPDSLKGLVASINGLDDGALLRRPALVSNGPGGTGAAGPITRSTSAPTLPKAGSPTKAPSGTPNVTQACSTYWDQHEQTAPTAYGRTKFPTPICGYTPVQLREAYQAGRSGRTGAGVRVAIIDAYGSPTMPSDANRYSQATKLPVFTSGQYTQHLFKPFGDITNCQGELGWNEEQTLDIEAVHAMAPGASIVYVGAQDCGEGLDTAMNWVIQNHSADIVSDSWGDNGEDRVGSELITESRLFVQAAAEGIGFYFSSGDDGDNQVVGNTAVPEPDYPASDSNVTAVGGTSLAISSTGGYEFETGWGTQGDSVTSSGYSQSLPGTFVYGAGGGTSRLIPQPSYQAGIVPNALATANGSAKMRVVPDVAAVADPYTGFEIGDSLSGTFSLSSIGGTSLACPIFAGIQALASQGRFTPIGFANPLLYSLAGKAFHDVKPQSSTLAVATESGSALITLDSDTSLTTAAGFDNVTGMGSPYAQILITGEAVKAGQVHPIIPVPIGHHLFTALTPSVL